MTEQKFNIKVDRVSRELGSREETARVKKWVNPSHLDTPPAPPGYKYYWVRDQILSQPDDKNVLNRLRQGYEPVHPDELPDGYLFSTDSHRKLEGGVVRSGDLILMKAPIEIVEQRTEYFREKTRRLEASVNAELQKHNSSRMPIINESKSTYTKGNPEFQSDSSK